MRTRVWATLILAVAAICMPGCKKKEAVQDEAQGKSDTTPDAAQETKETPVMSVNQESFGRTSEGREVDLYTLTNSNGLKARITNYGAILVSLEVPDRRLRCTRRIPWRAPLLRGGRRALRQSHRRS